MESVSKSRPMTPAQLDQFAAELDAVREEVMSSLGERDARYIRRVFAAVRYTEAAGRILIYCWFLPPLWALGVLLLGLSKILDNMELGHNVIHGQYDWMNDPYLKGANWEWDIVGTADNWRLTHNYKHHTYTNIKGMDDDIGYGLLRLFPEQRWRPFYLFQPVVALLFALLFEWGVAIQELRLGRLSRGAAARAEIREKFQPVKRKMRRQIIKDYLIFPLLGGPLFLPVLVGNMLANIIRSLWTYMIIFCGHFTADVDVFPKSVLKSESRGQWYARQVRGSGNLRGSKLFHILSGNLSHQIEHHLFPDMPANRYAEVAPRVQEICEKYGIHYNSGRLSRQFGQVLWRILRYSLPSRPGRLDQVRLTAE